MQCENCIHKKPCGAYQQKFLSHLKNLTVTECPYYKEKDKVIDLPCKVGDTVYVIYDGYVTSALILAFYIDPLGEMMDLNIKTKKETAVGFETIIDKDNYTFDDIYISREEAEKALKELKESNSTLLNKENEK